MIIQEDFESIGSSGYAERIDNSGAGATGTVKIKTGIMELDGFAYGLPYIYAFILISDGEVIESYNSTDKYAATITYDPTTNIATWTNVSGYATRLYVAVSE